MQYTGWRGLPGRRLGLQRPEGRALWNDVPDDEHASDDEPGAADGPPTATAPPTAKKGGDKMSTGAVVGIAVAASVVAIGGVMCYCKSDGDDDDGEGYGGTAAEQQKARADQYKSQQEVSGMTQNPMNPEGGGGRDGGGDDEDIKPGSALAMA